MTCVDTNVIMYAVGREHPLRKSARRFFEDAIDRSEIRLCTSAEVLQELMHAYLPSARLSTLDAAMRLADSTTDEIWSVDKEDVTLARELAARHPELSARDLLHLASCRRRGVTQAKTFDRALASVLAR